MTDEELDEARENEAWRIWTTLPPEERHRTAPTRIAARLAREGWKPVTRNLLIAREAAARATENLYPNWAKQMRSGESDCSEIVDSALTALQLKEEGWEP